MAMEKEWGRDCGEKYKKIISDLHFPSIHLNSLSIQTYPSPVSISSSLSKGEIWERVSD
jgi:hypothetical protein